MPGQTVLMVGTFDGVHLGHAALARRARQLAAPGSAVVALVFHPHPLTVLAPGSAPGLLTTLDQRAGALRDLGVDHVHQLAPGPDVLNLSPREFVQRCAASFAPHAWVEGPDFRFGQGRAGDVRTLAALGDELGFAVSIVEPVSVDLTDQTVVTASSTLTRWLIAHGRVADAARILGRPYELEGTVVRGDQRGRQIGFPTANLDTPNLLPADGVYAAIATLPDGRALPAAVHVGPRATFNSAARTVEAYVIGWPGPLAPPPLGAWPGAAEYGWTLRLQLLSFLRDQQKFEGIDPLVAQIRRDVARASEIADRARDQRAALPSTVHAHLEAAR